MKLWLGLFAVSGLLWLFNLHLVLPGVNWVRQRFYQAKVTTLVDQGAGERAVLEATVSNLQQENARFKDLLGAPLSPGWQFLPSPVVKLSADTISLAVGESSGVKIGQTVIAYQKKEINNGVVLGRVVGVSRSQSTVKLLFSPDLSVKAVTATGATGIVTGDGQTAWLEQVVQASRLTDGDLILTAGGDGFLPGLVLGRVGEVVNQQAAVYQRAKLSWVIDPTAVVNAYIVSD